ncbi:MULTISPECIES: WhiB family transcriptional regulator [unclassified Pseudonocardia]|uniref:WhiB family transcriptional regulator n=1 Tax=unclassified Pseudonocardia TaxID=2619320 RepID=UPI001AC25759|nr:MULTISPECIES: WhiB family transcriptional regulator [unclassified Pseudonocardia]MBN9097949.1 WhiB family transcriptional regulator [Pseudonocardia sp.]
MFFPVGDAGPAQRQIAAAKAVCRRCPVTEEYLAWALHARCGRSSAAWSGRSE